MGENSAIEWTDHTFNPWVGCTKISPGCDHCYAESWAKRSGLVEWGGARRRTSKSNWNQVWKWDRAARAAGVRKRVFCASLADVFDNEVPEAWRVELFDMIARTTHLDWLLLTKRIGNACRMLDEIQKRAPIWARFPWPHVWIGATVVNQEEANRDIPKLLATPAAVRFLSCEPLLGPLDLWRVHISGANQYAPHEVILNAWSAVPGIDWLIAGGESGPHARPMHSDWARSLRDQCVAAVVPFLFKQWGEWSPSYSDARHVYVDPETGVVDSHPSSRMGQRGLPVQNAHSMFRVGKKSAGRELDGRTWDQFPVVPS